MRRAGALVLSLVLVFVTSVVVARGAAAHHPEGGSSDPIDGPHDTSDSKQHGGTDGHLPPSSSQVDQLGKIDLTGVRGGIADVGAFGDYAYLAAFAPECAGRPGAQGTGVHVVDVSDPTNPVKVNFLAAESNSFVGEGVHVFRFDERDILVHNNETCNSSLPVTSGFAVWDVTDPTAATKLGQYGDPLPAVSDQIYHTTHSVQGFIWRDRAYAVAQDNQENQDVDIFDITNVIEGTGPAVLVSERGLEDWPSAHSPFANGDNVFHHDMQFKKIGGHAYLLVSYWDAGWVVLNIDDPANPVFVDDSDHPTPDPLTGFAIPDGNAHQAFWSPDGKFILGTDEDFSPTRIDFDISSGPNAGAYSAGEFTWTVPVSTNFASGFAGQTVYGGSGCDNDANGNGTSDRDEVPSADSTGADAIVFTRGHCFFSDKVESGQSAGYDMVVVGNSHEGTRDGLTPDAFSCGAPGHFFFVTASAICIGHRATHLLFGDAPEYTGAEHVDLPAIGTIGAAITADRAFDGWGYVHLLDAESLDEIDAYAVPESLDPAYASGFGNLTVHEVKTDPRNNADLAYVSYYDAGFRVLRYGTGGLKEEGHFIADGGNDFWGVFPLKEEDGEVSVLLSDRDSGLWTFRFTGEKKAPKTKKN